MHLKKEVGERAPRSPLGDILLGTKLTALIVGLAAGIPLGMISVFQIGLHTCKDPVVVHISQVRTSPDPELDAMTGFDRRATGASECRECHAGHHGGLTLSDTELCRTDDPDCKWVYEVDRDRTVRRAPNTFGRPLRAIRKPTNRIHLHSRDEPSPDMPFPDMLRYESF